LLQKYTTGYQKIRLAVMHADAFQRAEELRVAILAEFPNIEIPINEFTPGMGAHAGPGLLGLGYLYG
jgi:fatty acid-binding protein DegV